MDRGRNLGAESAGWPALAVVAVAEVLAMSVWFSAGAVSGPLLEEWGLGPGSAASLSAAVQLGFVAGTALAAALNLADLLSSRVYFTACASLSGLANLGLLLAEGYLPALGLRFVTGLFLAGVYPPAMKMVATWFRATRGLALGILIGALTLGKATPYLVRALEHAGWRGVIAVTSIGSFLAAGLVAFGYRDGPQPFERRAFSWRLAGTILAHRPTRLAILGYLGHMWELYAMWVWIPAFIAASLAAREAAGLAPLPPATDDLLAFGAIAAGSAGCIWGGRRADRAGRERLTIEAMAASGLGCVAIGLVFGASPWLVALVAGAWGFFVVADSAQFSALVTEVAPRHAVGTALTLQTSLGFLLTNLTILLLPVLVSAAGWRWAFVVLAAGPASGIVAMRALARSRGSAASLP